MDDMTDNLTQIRSAKFPGVFLRLDGNGVHPSPSGSGTVNCQYSAGPWENFRMIRNANYTVSFESYAFPNAYLRMDGTGLTKFQPGGGGVVNAQAGAGPFEQFRLIQNDDGTQTLMSSTTDFDDCYLRMDGTGVREARAAGGVVNAQITVGDYEKFVLCKCITHQQCSDTINLLAEWFPEEADQLNRYRSDIIAACCPPFAPKTSMSILEAVQYARSVLPPVEVRSEDDDACAAATFALIFDAISLILSLVGLYGLGKAWRDRRYYWNFSPYVRGWSRALKDLMDSPNARAAAKNLLNLINQLYNTFMIREVWAQLKKEMSWWRWVTAGIIALAQIVAWFATETAALVAEVVLVVPSLVTAITDSVDFHRDCFGTT